VRVYLSVAQRTWCVIGGGPAHVTSHVASFFNKSTLCLVALRPKHMTRPTPPSSPCRNDRCYR
jgi:hypothetical protein